MTSSFETETRCPTCGSRVEKLSDVDETVRTNVMGLRVREFHTVAWHNKPAPEGKADCVAFYLELEGGLPPLVIRLKSAAAVDAVVGALKRHRADAWPDAPPSSVA